MESSSLMITLITISISLSLLIHPSHSQTCPPQDFQTPNKKFKECVNLPELGSTLYFTYNSTNSSLSFAYVGYPEKPDGWVAWAINPNSTGMVGAQAFIGFKADGTFVVKTYNIKSHAPIKVSKLTFDSWDLSGESESRSMTIFASVKLVDPKAVSVNHVWNAGATVTEGVPDGHSMDEPHTMSVGVLKLVGGNAPQASAPAPSSKKSGASDCGRRFGMGFWFGGVVLIGCFLGF